MDRYIDMNSISTIDRMIYRRRKAKEENRRIWVVTIYRERERGGCAKKNKKVKNFRQQKSKSKRN